VLQHCLPQSIRRTLNELPKSLDETYERVLKEIGLANRDHAYRLLQCLTVAIRPLRVEELAEILVLDFDGAEGATPKVIQDWRREDRQQSVLSTCSSLITVVDDGDLRVIQFSHFSVKEFLTSNRLGASKGDTSDFHIIPEPAHATLAQACLGILLQLDGSLDNDQVDSSFPLARYASQNWVEHAQFGHVSSRVEDGMRRLFDSSEPYLAAWLQLYDIDQLSNGFGMWEGRGSPLYYASLCGFRDLAEHIIAEHPEHVNARGGRDLPPMVAALHGQHLDVAELLYQHGASVDITGFNGRTPIITASVGRSVDVVRWLLDHGADVDSRDENHWAPLISAASIGNLEVVLTLLQYGASINATNIGGYTPLSFASLNGHLEVVKVLLKHGADVNAKANDYSNPLQDASRMGKLDIARLLLDHLADIGVEDMERKTPLHQASYWSSAAMVHLLLDRGANPNAEDVHGQTPLHLVSHGGKTESVRLLLDHGASVDVRNKEGRTPLQEAFWRGSHGVAHILTEYGAHK
jgi:ankyrin repeat protein